MKQYAINDSEWVILKILWEKPNSSLKEIYEAVDQAWEYTTVRTLVTRLLNKGIISADKSILKNYKYAAIVKEDDCKLKETEGFIDKVFDGSVSMLVSTLAKKNKISERDYEQLMAIIDKMEA